MAAAPDNPPHPPPPLSPFEPIFFGSFHPPPPSFADVQNHDRHMDSNALPPIPPPEAPVLQPLVDAAAVAATAAAVTTNEVPPNDDERPADEDGSEHSGSDSEDEDDNGDHFEWQPIEEDRTEASEDEIAWMVSKGERSAVDHAVWEKKTFYDLNDKELVPGESGRIDWLVEHFNGTKENPNKEHIMRSHTVNIGGYDWRIKFYPRGDDTDYLSLYIENVTLQSLEYAEIEEFTNLPLPLLDSMDKLKKRKAVCAQVCIIMYNPAEPRTYEYRRDAHQFTKSRSDYGWPQFTYESRRHFLHRNHHQRQAILRDDKLAFSAYIRIVNDPTGCLWAHDGRYEDSISLTGLRPFAPQLVMFAAELPLLHFAPFRHLIQQHQGSRITFWLQTLLFKMMSRRHSASYAYGATCEQSDPIVWLRFLAKRLRSETNAEAINQLMGTLDPDDGAAVSGNRLKTKMYPSVQAAIDNHKSSISTPVMLTLELQRSEFDKEKRRWEKLTNRVEIEDDITVGSKNYTLFAFATHCGDLESNTFNVYVRPRGPSTPWYKYSEGNVTAMTHKQAVEKHRGSDESPIPHKLRRHSHHRADHSVIASLRYEDQKEVAHVLMYVREDHAQDLSTIRDVEKWEVPLNVRKGIPPTFEGVEEPSPPTAVYERFSEADEAAAGEMEQALAVEPPAEPPVEPAEGQDARKNTDGIDAGYATPFCWAMDGEDVIMSDVDDEEPIQEKTEETDKPQEKPLESITVDVLGREYYSGQTHNGAYHGQGTLITMNGDQYTGSFSHNLKSGHGTMIYAHTGNTYTGDWAEGLPHGQGTLVEAATGNVFEGGFKQGKKHGSFVLRGTVTEEDKGVCSICYDREINTAFYDCGHVVACKECAMAVESCPVCRRRVAARLELFGVKMTIE